RWPYGWCAPAGGRSPWCPDPGRGLSAPAPLTRGDLRWLVARREFGLERGKLLVHLGGGPGLVEFGLDLVGVAADVLADSRLDQLVHRSRAGLRGGDLVLGPLQRLAVVAEARGDPRDALVHRGLGLGRGVLSLQHFLLRPEGVYPLLQRGKRLLELLPLFGELLALWLQGVDLRLPAALPRHG